VVDVFYSKVTISEFYWSKPVTRMVGPKQNMSFDVCTGGSFKGLTIMDVDLNWQ